MWGPAESGTRLYQQDQQASQLNALAMQNTTAQIRHNNALASEEESKAQRAQMMNKMAMEQQQKEKDEAPLKLATSTSDQMGELKQKLLRLASDSAWFEPEKSAQIVERLQRADELQAIADLDKEKLKGEKVKNKIAAYDSLLPIVSTMEGPQDLEKFKVAAMKADPEHADMYKGMKYGAQTKEILMSTMMKAKDYAKVQGDKDKLAETKRKNNEAIKLMDVRIDLERARTAKIKEGLDAQGKENPSIKLTAAQYAKHAKDALLDEYRDDMDPRSATNLGDDIGVEAATMAKKERIDPQEAIHRIIEREQKPNGKLENYLRATPKLNAEQTKIKAVLKKLGHTYDPTKYTYKVMPDGSLKAFPKGAQ